MPPLLHFRVLPTIFWGDQAAQDPTVVPHTGVPQAAKYNEFSVRVVVKGVPAES
jgi:hypothetical protein